MTPDQRWGDQAVVMTAAENTPEPGVREPKDCFNVSPDLEPIAEDEIKKLQRDDVVRRGETADDEKAKNYESYFRLLSESKPFMGMLLGNRFLNQISHKAEEKGHI